MSKCPNCEFQSLVTNDCPKCQDALNHSGKLRTNKVHKLSLEKNRNDDIKWSILEESSIEEVIDQLQEFTEITPDGKGEEVSLSKNEAPLIELYEDNPILTAYLKAHKRGKQFEFQEEMNELLCLEKMDDKEIKNKMLPQKTIGKELIEDAEQTVDEHPVGSNNKLMEKKVLSERFIESTENYRMSLKETAALKKKKKWFFLVMVFISFWLSSGLLYL